MTYLGCSCGFIAPAESLPVSCLQADGYAYCPECGGKLYAEERAMPLRDRIAARQVIVRERDDVPMPEAFAWFVEHELDLSGL